MLPNFKLTSSGKISERFIRKGITTFHDAVRYVHKLPYGRNLRPDNHWTVIHEGKGTCSTKHACLKALAEENMINSIELHMCIYAMNEKNTPGVGAILSSYDLPYILEAHAYLFYDGKRFDYTFPEKTEKPWEETIIIEVPIDADQVGAYKKEYHQSILKEWIKRDKIPYTFKKIWDIREACIAAISD